MKDSSTMAELKTTASDANVEDFIASIADQTKRDDCHALNRMMQDISACSPVMWGQSILGYGRYHYRYASGRSGVWFRTGFSPRVQALTIYIMPGYSDFSEILSRLGTHRKGRSCLYVRRLANIDMDVLHQLVTAGWNDMQKRYPNDS